MKTTLNTSPKNPNPINTNTSHDQPTQSNDGDKEDLNSTAKQEGEKHTLAGRPEYISMHQLPSKLFLGILLLQGLKVELLEASNFGRF